MSSRVYLQIENNTGATLTCTDVGCESFDVVELKVGTIIPNGGSSTFVSSTNDRIFCTWKSSVGGGLFKMGMTCPKSSDNSAYGSLNAGLQTYKSSGEPAHFKYVPGTPNQADWDDPDHDNGDVIPYCDCS